MKAADHLVKEAMGTSQDFVVNAMAADACERLNVCVECV